MRLVVKLMLLIVAFICAGHVALVLIRFVYYFVSGLAFCFSI